MLKNIFQKFSIRKKLIFLFSLSAGITLLLATTSTFIYNIYKDKNIAVKESIKLAKVSGKNIAASLQFLDRDSANSMLKPILSDKNVYSINIYDVKGILFTAIGDNKIQLNNWATDEFMRYPEVNISTSWDYIDILTSIIHAGEKIGYLQIISNANVIKKRIVEQTFVSLFIVLFTFIIIFAMAFRFEKVFSKPLYNLLDAVRKIKNNSEFDVYLTPITQDEFRELYIEFNRMADEIKKRDNILKKYNIDLKNIVASTNQELKITQSNLNEASILATTDPLTNLSNRRNSMDQFDLMITAAKLEDKPLGIIMLDIDHFKQVNDTLGHQAGDIVLKQVAQLLSENARDNDIVGRIGGEEFLILCKNADVDTTYKVAERIRYSVEQKIIVYEKNKTTQVTISLGLCSIVPALQSKEILIKIADDALYKAKETGRNRTIRGLLA